MNPNDSESMLWFQGVLGPVSGPVGLTGPDSLPFLPPGSTAGASSCSLGSGGGCLSCVNGMYGPLPMAGMSVQACPGTQKGNAQCIPSPIDWITDEM